MHVIGFDVTDEERKQLNCIAEAGGGSYYTATSASELELAAKKVVEISKVTGGLLEVTAVKEGEPFQARVYVYRQGEQDRLAYENYVF